VHLRKPSLVASFLRIITADAEKSRWLRRNVLSLVLRLPYSIPQNVIFTILTNLSNLRELDISGCVCSFSDEELSQLGNSGLCIRLLRLNASYVGAVGVMVADWPAILKLVAAVPTVILLDITVHDSLELPKVAPLGLGLLSFKLKSKSVADAGPLLDFLVGGRNDNEHLQVFTHDPGNQRICTMFFPPTVAISVRSLSQRSSSRIRISATARISISSDATPFPRMNFSP
jgi:hypothetical protein